MSGEGLKVKKNLQGRADVSECCKRPGTLKRIDQPDPTTRLYGCIVCGRRHRFMGADPGHFGLRK